MHIHALKGCESKLSWSRHTGSKDSRAASSVYGPGGLQKTSNWKYRWSTTLQIRLMRMIPIRAPEIYILDNCRDPMWTSIVLGSKSSVCEALTQSIESMKDVYASFSSQRTYKTECGDNIRSIRWQLHGSTSDFLVARRYNYNDGIILQWRRFPHNWTKIRSIANNVGKMSARLACQRAK